MTREEIQKKQVNRKLVLKFPKRLIDRPVIYHLVKDFDLMFNILKANIVPNEEGILVIELSGLEHNFLRGLEFIKKLGVTYQYLSKDIIFDNKKCTSCGVCIPICPVDALKMDHKTFLVSFYDEKCIACELCIKSCPVKAIQLKF